MASTGWSGGDSYYVKSAENSPTSPAYTPDFAGHISELEEMHEVADVELNGITRPKVIFSHTNELKSPELNDAETNPQGNHQDNGTTPPVNTQPSPPHSTWEDTLVASAKPTPRPRVEASDTTLQVREGYIPDVRLLGANYMLYGVYKYWVHQSPGDHLDGRIAKDSKWQER